MKKRTIRNCKVTVSKKSEIKYDSTFMPLVLRGLKDFYVTHDKNQYISRKDLFNYVKRWYVVDKNFTCEIKHKNNEDPLIDHALDLCISRLRHCGCLIDREEGKRDGLYKINKTIKDFMDVADDEAVKIIMENTPKKISENKVNVPSKYLNDDSKVKRINVIRNGVIVFTAKVKASKLKGYI